MFGRSAFVVKHPVTEEIVYLELVTMSAETERKSRKLLDFILKYIRHIVIKLFRSRLCVHGYHCASHGRGQFAAYLSDVSEVGYGGGIVILEGVGIDAEKLRIACRKGEIRVSKEVTVGVCSRTEAIVVPEQNYVGYAELL